MQVAAKYLTDEPATWGEGDWDGGPGGSFGDPPPGNGRFDQLDLVAALTAGQYLAGPYAAIGPHGVQGDGQTSIGYNAQTGHVWVDAPAGKELTSVHVDRIYVPEPSAFVLAMIGALVVATVRKRSRLG